MCSDILQGKKNNEIGYKKLQCCCGIPLDDFWNTTINNEEQREKKKNKIQWKNNINFFCILNIFFEFLCSFFKYHQV